MKKLLVSIIAIFYLGTSIGATVNLHYCMGQYVNWDFGHEQHHTCDKCGMEKKKKNGCCEDKYKVLQVEKDQKASASYKLAEPPVIAITTIYPSFDVAPIATISEAYPVSNAPPPNRLPVHIRYCVFRI